MSRTILDVHILQTVPPSNLNRDDTGSAKTAVYGGVRRARVSSQAWKRPTREAFATLLDPSELGVRTKRVTEALSDEIRSLDTSIAQADSWQLAEVVLKNVITGPKFKLAVPDRKADKESASEASYLIFFSARQLRGLAELAVEGVRSSGDIATFFKDKKNRARARELANTNHSVDIALFGRMVADAADINVDAAVQVAHAISVHAVENESDYFTAVDDKNTLAEPGAGMIGTVDFNSATLYRYAALDVDLLSKNLGNDLREDEAAATPVRRAVEAFVEGFITSLPTGKINTFGNHTLPDAVIVKLRRSRPISFVGAFETPVVATETGGHVGAACRALASFVPDIEQTYGVQDGTPTWVLRVGTATEPLTALGTKVGLKELVDAVGAAAAQRLESRE